MSREVNARQLEALRWIADGCPEGRWPPDSNGHKPTAAALNTRGLVTVRGHGPTWEAAVTEDGRYYLEHGSYPRASTSTSGASRAGSRARKRAAPAAPPPPIDDKAATTLRDAKRLLVDIERHGGMLTVADPSSSTRARYRRLLHACREHHLVPPGKELRFTGRDSGDLVMALDDGSDKSTSDWLRVRTTTRRITTNTESLRGAMAARKILHHRSPQLRDRAASMILALAEELRGHELKLGINVKLKTPKLFLQVEGRKRDVTITELTREVPHVPTPAEKRELRAYPWRHVPTVDHVPSGRLKLTVDRVGWVNNRSKCDEWTDKPNTPLDKQIATIAREIKAGVVSDLDAQRREEERRAAAHEAWEREKAEERGVWEGIRDTAIIRAREDVRRATFARLHDNRLTATEIRAFCEALNAATLNTATLNTATRTDTPTDQEPPRDWTTLRTWLTWARAAADDLDPTRHPERLDDSSFDVSVTHDDIRPYMKGWHTDRPDKDYRADRNAATSDLPEPRPWHLGMRGKNTWWRH